MLVAGCDPGPPEKVLIGTWERTYPSGMDSTWFITFNPDHSMVSFGDSIMGDDKIYSRGTWSTAGKQLSIRHRQGEREEEVWTWDIVKVGANKLRLRFAGKSDEDIWIRRNVGPPREGPPIVDRRPFAGVPASKAPCLREPLERCIESYGPPIPTPEEGHMPGMHFFKKGELKISVVLLGDAVGDLRYEAERPIPDDVIMALLRANAADSDWLPDPNAPRDNFTEVAELDRSYKRADGGALARHIELGTIHMVSLWTPEFDKAHPNLVK